MDIAEQAVEAKEAGIAYVVEQLQTPDDLLRLAELRAANIHELRTNKAGLTAMVTSQVEAAQSGVDLLDRAHRHIHKLRGALDAINMLCVECASLVVEQERIRALALAHGNVKKVLAEIEEIIDLPARAAMCEAMLQEDDANLVPAFEALTVLEGTSNNAKAVWNRTVNAKNEVTALTHYLDQVAKVVEGFEERLWSYVRDYDRLAQEQPTLLVDCMRVVELQELLDKQYAKVRMGAANPKRYRERLFQELEAVAEGRFEPLVAQAESCGGFNKTVRYDQNGDLIVREDRDEFGRLQRLIRLTGIKEELVDDPDIINGIDIIEEHIFDEGEFLDELLEGLYTRLDELAAVYDYVGPCCPPSYGVFENVFQMYHVHFAIVVDVLGHRAHLLSNKGSLRVMEWVQKYMETLRNLGIEEDMVRLGMSGAHKPEPGEEEVEEDVPGIVLLMRSFVERMESTMTKWYTNILVVDLKGKPKVAPDGTLYTPGAFDFFRILSEEVQVIEDINDRGEVMFAAAQCSLRVMKGFQDAQIALLSNRVLSFEMCCALLNNNITCHDQSEEFADDIQSQLEPQYKSKLDIDAVCRGFLEVAKLAMHKLVESMFMDPGLAGCFRNMYTPQPDYFNGVASRTLIATLKDYFTDVATFVQPSFLKRVADLTFEQLVHRLLNIYCQGMPTVNAALLSRMHADEDETEAYFSKYLKPDRLAHHISVMSDMRELLSADSAPALGLAYSTLLALQPTFTPEALQKLLTSRSDLQKKTIMDLMALAKDTFKKKPAPTHPAGKPATATAATAGTAAGKPPLPPATKPAAAAAGTAASAKATAATAADSAAAKASKTDSSKSLKPGEKGAPVTGGAAAATGSARSSASGAELAAAAAASVKREKSKADALSASGSKREVAALKASKSGRQEDSSPPKKGKAAKTGGGGDGVGRLDSRGAFKRVGGGDGVGRLDSRRPPAEGLDEDQDSGDASLRATAKKSSRKSSRRRKAEEEEEEEAAFEEEVAPPPLPPAAKPASSGWWGRK